MNRTATILRPSCATIRSVVANAAPRAGFVGHPNKHGIGSKRAQSLALDQRLDAFRQLRSHDDRGKGFQLLLANELMQDAFLVRSAARADRRYLPG